MSTVLFLVNHEVVIYNFRLEIIERLLSDGHKVVVSSPEGERIEKLKALGCIHKDITFDRHGKNPLKELTLIRTYKKLMKEVKPDIVFTFTIKPNIYGSMAAGSLNIPCVANITGLGTAVENGGTLQKLTVLMYKKAFKKIQRVFFQNRENEQFFTDNRIAPGKHKIIPGSGVNLERFAATDYPVLDGYAETANGTSVDSHLRFAFISRIMKEKGIDEYLRAARIIKKKHPNTEFHVCGFCEEGTRYPEILEKYDRAGIITYHGNIEDVASMMQSVHCIIHPTYYPEGISNVLLEACACARPIITTRRSGCREVLDEGQNGYFVNERDYKDLVKVIEKFMAQPIEKIRAMGQNARKKVEKQFDRQLVVEAYIRELKASLKEI